MSLDRKDLRIKLDANDHAGLALLAEADESELAEWAERVLVRVIRRRVHAAMVLAAKAERLGIVGRAIPADE
jgi:predicted HicB family RNase H-like nuclease